MESRPPNLNVNIGLRYEFFNAFHEQYGRDLPFDPATCPNGYCPQGSQFDFPQKLNLEPRLSFAWAPKALHGKTVIRSGSGFYEGEGQLGDLNAPSDNFTQRLSLSSASFPGLSFPADSFYAEAQNSAVTPRALSRNLGVPTVIQWGLQIQQALPFGFILDTGYIGYHGYHQFTRWYINGCALDSNPCVREYPAYGPIDIKQTDSNNHFEGWQTSLRRQFKSGWGFQANHMWSHAINDDSQGGGETDYPEINSCRTCDIASSDVDIRHTFSMNTIYRLPFGTGRTYFNNSGVANAILGGWELSSTATARTGLPVNVTITRSASAVPDGLNVENGASFQRPNYVGGDVSVVPDGPDRQQLDQCRGIYHTGGWYLGQRRPQSDTRPGILAGGLLAFSRPEAFGTLCSRPARRSLQYLQPGAIWPAERQFFECQFRTDHHHSQRHLASW